jgi:hypothetical protein
MLIPMDIELSPGALARLMRPVHGKGGFQHLLRKLQTQVTNSILTADEADIEKLERYSHSYGLGGFQDRTKPSASELQQLLDFGD